MHLDPIGCCGLSRDLTNRHRPQIFWIRSRFTHGTQRKRLVPLGQPTSFVVGQQDGVVPFRHIQIEQGLQQAMNMGRGKQVVPPCDQRDTLSGVVHGDGEMIAGCDILSRQHDVPKDIRLGDLFAPCTVVPGQRSGFLHGAFHVQTKRVGLTSGNTLRALGFGQVFANARIDGAIRSMMVQMRRGTRIGDFRGDVRSGAKAGIKYPNCSRVFSAFA